MNQELNNILEKLAKPRVKSMQGHKRALKTALLFEHQNRSFAFVFCRIINDFIKTMSLGKKSTAIATFAVFAFVIIAGVVGPSASQVAQAEANNTIKRAFARFVNLTDQERNELDIKFQERVEFKAERGAPVKGFVDLSDEERESRHQEMKASLLDSLVEAQSASDLEIISADQMPIPGFLGKAGRAFGFDMMKEGNSNFGNLPEDIRIRMEERKEHRDDMVPVKFLIYTNQEGQKVVIGVNENDEPVIKFVKPSELDNLRPSNGKSFWKRF
jgi:hypothetical protein